MNCAQHPDISAVGACSVCGIGLCSHCAFATSPLLCTTCTLNHNKEVARTFWSQLALMAALFVVVLVGLVGKLPLILVFPLAVFVAFFPSGWKFLGRYLSPGGRYFDPIARWVNLALHVTFAALLGIILGPVFLFNAWKELKTIQETKRRAKQ